MSTLTDHQLERQDYVDNAIFALFGSVNPSLHEIQWDIEMIGEVRDVIEFYLVERLQACSEIEFYPHVEE